MENVSVKRVRKADVAVIIIANILGYGIYKIADGCSLFFFL